MKDCVPDFYAECLIALWIWRTIPFVLVFIGTCGNIVNIIILSRLRQYSTSVFLLSLSTAELLFLWVVSIPDTLSVITSTSVNGYGETICRLRKWLGHTTGAFSPWVLVLLNIERFLLIKAPVFSRSKLTPRNSLIAIGTVFVVLAMLNGHFMIGWTIQTNTDNSTSQTIRVCVYISDEYEQFSKRVWSVLMFALYQLIPVCVIFVGNINLAVALLSRRKRLTTVHPSNEQNILANKKRGSSTLLLFVMCTFFLVTTMPYCVYQVLKGTVVKIEGRPLARWQLASAIVHVLLYSNFSFNFFFYFATGTLFKQEWRKLAQKTRRWFRNITGTER